jgi:superfamily II DNA or RNA helicase
MNSQDDPPDEEAFSTDGPPNAPFRLRAYQAEMVAESMKSNIICVMDTGSGKTHMYCS